MKFKADVYMGSLYQLAIVFIFFWLSRFVFMAHNSSLIGLDSAADILALSIAGIRMDACMLGYANALFILMRFAPWPWVCSKGWIVTSNWLLSLTNSILLVLNLGDTAYFPFTGYRMSWQSFTNVFSDPGTPSLLISYLPSYWWAYLMAILSVGAMIWLATRVRLTEPFPRISSQPIYWAVRVFLFLIMTAFSLICIRGWTFSGRPLDKDSVIAYVANPKHLPAVTNTPFYIFFSMGEETTVEKISFYSPEELSRLRNSLISPPGNRPNGKNVFLLIIESGGSVLSEIFNPLKGDSTYTRALPFVDSLASRSLINRNLYASGRTSAQGITHILGGIPWFGNSYIVGTPYTGNTFDTPASLLSAKGYNTRFYYGCAKGDHHIDETAKLSGFKSISTRESFGDDSQFDGRWGIFDIPMAEFIVKDLSSSYSDRHPFFASWFTVTAHSPFNLPEGTDLSDYHYKKESPEQAMEYTDKAIEQFFRLAEQQPWYENTIFIITSDHGQRDLGSFYSDNVYCYSHLPFLIFTPDGSIEPGVIDSIPMSQIDIAPTLLDLTGYDRPHVSLGTSMFDPTHPHYAIVDSFGSYNIVGNKYIVALDNSKWSISQVFDINEKPYPHTPLQTYDKALTDDMLRWFKALMQDYTERINSDNLNAGR